MHKEQDNLKEAIALLKKRQALELKELKEHMHIMHENLKPFNLLKNAVHQITSSKDIKNNIIDNIIGLASGYVSKKLFVGTSHNIIKQVLGIALQAGVTNVTSKNADVIKSLGEKGIQFVLKSFKKDELNPSVAER